MKKSKILSSAACAVVFTCLSGYSLDEDSDKIGPVNRLVSVDGTGFLNIDSSMWLGTLEDVFASEGVSVLGAIRFSTESSEVGALGAYLSMPFLDSFAAISGTEAELLMPGGLRGKLIRTDDDGTVFGTGMLGLAEDDGKLFGATPFDSAVFEGGVLEEWFLGTEAAPVCVKITGRTATVITAEIFVGFETVDGYDFPSTGVVATFEIQGDGLLETINVQSESLSYEFYYVFDGEGVAYLDKIERTEGVGNPVNVVDLTWASWSDVDIFTPTQDVGFEWDADGKVVSASILFDFYTIAHSENGFSWEGASVGAIDLSDGIENLSMSDTVDGVYETTASPFSGVSRKIKYTEGGVTKVVEYFFDSSGAVASIDADGFALSQTSSGFSVGGSNYADISEIIMDEYVITEIHFTNGDIGIVNYDVSPAEITVTTTSNETFTNTFELQE